MRSTQGIILFMALCVMVLPGYAQIGIFQTGTDIGTPGAAGSAVYDVADKMYTVTGSGADIWGTADNFYYLYNEVSGNFSLKARVYLYVDSGDSTWAKAGPMVRDNLTPGSSFGFAMIRASGQDFGPQWRETQDGSAASDDSKLTGGWDGTAVLEGLVEIERIGKTINYYYYTAGEEVKTLLHSQNISGLEDPVYAGLAVTSHSAGVTSYAEFTEVEFVELPATPVITTRSFSVSSFKPGQTFTTTLLCQNTLSTDTEFSLTETPPAGFTISEISHGGTMSGGVITWKFSAPPGITQVTYKMTVPADYNPAVSGYSVQWSGSSGVALTLGPAQLYMIDVSVGEKLFSFDFQDAAQLTQWEDLAGTFDIANGQFVEIDDADGPLVTLTGDPTLTDVAVSVKGMGLVADADWGIVFRCSGIGDFYSWQFVNGYLRMISYVGGSRTEPLGISITYAEELNAWQEFTVIVKGNVIYAFFNGEIQGVVVDDALTEGQVGLFGWVNGGTDLSNVAGGIAFDDFVVSKVGGAPVGVEQWSLY